MPKLHPTSDLLVEALEVGIRHSLSLWDAVYAALARQLDARLITADRRLFRTASASRVGITLLDNA